MIPTTGEQEKVAFEQMKLQVADLNEEDDTIIRFLRAREYDIVKAEEMLRKNHKWRIDNNISSYLNWRPSPQFRDDNPFICSGYDNEGSAVIYAPMGRWNTRERLEMGLREDCINYQYHMLEKIMYYIKTSKSHQMIFIADQAEITYYKIAHVESAQLFFGAFKIFEQHYPEILKKAIVINASWLFSTIFAFLKPAFTGKTVSKIQIFNSDQDKYIEALLEIMPEDSIPLRCLEK